MTKQTKIATKILERAYARELIKAAVGQNDFGVGSYTPPGQPKPMNSGITPAGRALAAAPAAIGNAVDGAGSGIYGGFNAALGAPLSGIARAGQGIAHTNHVLNNDPQAQNASAVWGAAAKSLWSNTVAGGKDLLEAPSRMLGALDGPTHMQTLQAQQGAQLSPGQRDVFNFANNAAQNASTALVAAPAFGAVAKAVPRADKALQLYASGDVALRSFGVGTPEVNQIIANTIGMGNQAQAAEPQTAPQPAPEPTDVNYDQLSTALNSFHPEMQDAANEFVAENNADQTEVAQDAAATPAQQVAGPVPPPPTEQPAPEQQSEAATDYAALTPAKWSLPPNATPAQQKTVEYATNTINAAPPPVQKAVSDLATDSTNAEAKATVDAAATENIVRSVTADPAATANGATNFGELIGAKMEWYNNQDPHTQGLLALGLSAGVIGLISAINGGGLGSFLSMALGLGGAGLLGAASGAFGEDGQRAMGQGMASVGRMMGMDVPTDPVPVDRLVGENAPAAIHADVMKSAPTDKEKMQLLTNKTMRDTKAQSIRAELKQLDRAKQIAGMPEQAAVPVLMALGQAQGKPLTTEVAKQVYRNAVQTAQMANDKDSPMGKQLAEAQQFSTDADKYVAQQAGNYIAPYVAPAAPYVNKAIPYVNQASQYADQASQFLAPFFPKVNNAR
jgi:hypothetical protein